MENKMMKPTVAMQIIFKGSGCDSLSCPLTTVGGFHAGRELTREAHSSCCSASAPCRRHVASGA